MLHSSLRSALLPIVMIVGISASCSSPPVTHQQPAKSDTVVLPATDELAIARAYQERLRLGLGSPFRLIEMVLRDERLGSSRRAVADALLRALQDGHAYQVTPLALVDAGADSTSGLAQFDLIAEAITRAHDPRAGELAVDLAYEQLVRDGRASEAYLATVVSVAALLRDRQLALGDLHQLQHAAAQLRVRPAELVLRWRHERRFAVEQPTLLAADAAVRAEAERLALLLHGGLEAALTPVRSELARRLLPSSDPALPEDDAQRLLAMAARANRPPQNALVITLRSVARGAATTRDPAASQQWQQFLESAQDEESFVAGLRALQDSGAARVSARVQLAGAVALRPFAQQQLAVTDSLTSALLQKQFGVRVKVDAKVPRSWRQATLNDLRAALSDLRDVLPGIDLAGLRFDIRTIQNEARYQAYHDPRHRVIRLDPAAAAGTLAHELGHDVDWQLGRRKYNTTSNYATDFAVRKRKAMAYMIAALASDERPAEAFARRFEWYVAAALAAQGRSNGYLSSVQSDWIAGYGGGVRPDATLLARSSFATLLAQGAALDGSSKAAVEELIRGHAPNCADDSLSAGPRAPAADQPASGLSWTAQAPAYCTGSAELDRLLMSLTTRSASLLTP